MFKKGDKVLVNGLELSFVFAGYCNNNLAKVYIEGESECHLVNPYVLLPNNKETCVKQGWIPMYTREELIAICEKGIVQEKDWSNRDSADAQQQLGRAWVLLKAGCNFKIKTEKKDWTDACVTDEHTIWLDIEYNDFGFFEGGVPKLEIFYLPTLERLKEGGDWY